MTAPTPATGFLKSMPETLAGIMGEIEMQETRLVDTLYAPDSTVLAIVKGCRR